MKLKGASLIHFCNLFTHLGALSDLHLWQNVESPPRASDTCVWSAVCGFPSLWTQTMLHSGFLLMKNKKEGNKGTPDRLAHTSGCFTTPHLGFTAGSGPVLFYILNPCRGLCYYRWSHLTFIYFRFQGCFRYTHQKKWKCRRRAQVQSSLRGRGTTERWFQFCMVSFCTNFKHIYNNKQSVIHKMWYLQLLQIRVTAAEWIRKWSWYLLQ